MILLTSAVITPILVRLLQPTAYGEYATLMAVFGLLMILVSSGVTNGTRKYISEERDDAAWKDHVFGFYTRLAFLLSIAAAIGLVLIAESGLVGLVLGTEYTVYFYLLAVLTVAAQFRAFVRRVFMGLKLEHVSEPLEVLHRIGFGVAAVGLLLLGYGLTGVLVGHVLSSLLVVVVGTLYLSRWISLSSIVDPVPTSFPKQELLNFNHLATLNVLLIMSLYHVDVLMLEAFSPESDVVGFYRAALVLTQLLWLVPRSIEGVMTQSTSDLWNQGQIDRIGDIASRATRYTLLFSGLLALGLGALAADVVPIYYGDPYARAVLPVILLLPGTVGFAVARPLVAINQSEGNLRPVLAATGAAAVVNFALNAALIPQFGMAGAAVATSIGYGSLPVFQVWAARRLGYHPLTDIRPGRLLVTGTLSAIPIVGLAWGIEDPWTSLLVVPVVGFLVYAVLALATDALDAEELFEIGRALPAPIDEKIDAVRQRLQNADGVVTVVL